MVVFQLVLRCVSLSGDGLHLIWIVLMGSEGGRRKYDRELASTILSIWSSRGLGTASVGYSTCSGSEM